MHEADSSLRYSRHLTLPGFGAAGQEKLAGARVLLVGLGGLGSPAAVYLAAAGIGNLLLNDFDHVDVSNLQRQILYTSDDVNTAKPVAAAETLHALNPDCRLELLERRLDEADLERVVQSVDVVLDGSDNFGTRFAVNTACVHASRPLVSGAAIRYEGQITVCDVRESSSPCYACLYPEGAEAVEDCRSNGILAPLAGVIGSLMAMETIKLITGIGQPLIGRLWRLDAKTTEVSISQLKRDPACPVCGVRP
jgi:molybdopterin-synthase adenylyltransferase